MTRANIKKKLISYDKTHHRGLWKVAYADFVTAMMAFFLLLWVVESYNDDLKYLIEKQFKTTSEISNQNIKNYPEMNKKYMPLQEDRLFYKLNPQDKKIQPSPNLENAKNKKLVEIFKKASKALPKIYQRNLIGILEKDGILLSILDGKDDERLFRDKDLSEYGTKILTSIATAIKNMQNKIHIATNTNAIPYIDNYDNYNNWNISILRANSVRILLEELGIKTERIRTISGKADRDPLLMKDPRSKRNTRIEIFIEREPY